MKNGSSVIDLSPLIHRTGGYEAYDESEDDSSDTNPDFYINICQPLNPMHGVACPAGAAVCKVPVDGTPIVSAGSLRAEPAFARFQQQTCMLCFSLSPERGEGPWNWDVLGPWRRAARVCVGLSADGGRRRALRCGRKCEHTHTDTLVCVVRGVSRLIPMKRFLRHVRENHYACTLTVLTKRTHLLQWQGALVATVPLLTAEYSALRAVG